jgi:hypothetical protein
MKIKRLVIAGLVATAAIVPAAAALAGRHSNRSVGLVQQVRNATRAFQDVNQAIAAGYTSLGACVSGPDEGAMGIHYGGYPIDDGVLRPDQPEFLIYEQRGGQLNLVGVEYLQLAAAWTGPPPVLVGQQFQFVDAPNRYGLDPFYELHVWAWKNNPKGTFADWNPRVSCDQYTGDSRATQHQGEASHGVERTLMHLP